MSGHAEGKAAVATAAPAAATPAAALDTAQLGALLLPRTLGHEAGDTASRTGAFQRLPMVSPAKELIDSALRRASRVQPNRKLRNEAQKAKNRAARALDTLMKELCVPLGAYLRGFPRPGRLHPFERALLELTVGDGKYAEVLARVESLRRSTVEVGKAYATRASRAANKREAVALQEEGVQRLESVFSRGAFAVDELKGIAKALRRLPVVEPELPTVALVGAPNVGKSSLVQLLSSGLPEVQNYPFTTRSIKMGHFYVAGRRHQVTDTPGLLNRPEEDRNAMERLTLASLQHLPTAMLFVADLTAECGTSVADQEELKRRFPSKPWIDVFSKADLLEEELDEAAERRAAAAASSASSGGGSGVGGSSSSGAAASATQAPVAAATAAATRQAATAGGGASEQPAASATSAVEFAAALPVALAVSSLTGEGIDRLKAAMLAMLEEADLEASSSTAVEGRWAEEEAEEGEEGDLWGEGEVDEVGEANTLLLALLALLVARAASRTSPQPSNAAPGPLDTVVGKNASCGASPSSNAALLDRFLAPEGSRPLTQAEARAVACLLAPTVAAGGANDTKALATLRALHARWQGGVRPACDGRAAAACEGRALRYAGDSAAPSRFGSWVANLAAVLAVNADANSTHWAGLNAYSDMSWAEFSATVLMANLSSALEGGSGTRRLLARAGAALPSPSPSPAPPAYPPAADWAAAGKVLAPGSQLTCAASWAFAAAAAVESRLLIGANTSSALAAAQRVGKLSVRQILECAAAAANYTAPVCAGGYATDAFAYAAAAGLTAEAVFSFNRGADSCGAAAAAGRCAPAPLAARARQGGLVQITGTPAYARVAPARNMAALLKAVAAQPAVAYLAVEPAFQHYAGGLLRASPACAAAPLTHALLLTGYDTTAAAPYWQALNSLGAAWGQAGAVRLALEGDGAGACGMYRAAFYPGAAALVAPAPATPAAKVAAAPAAKGKAAAKGA
eukprot:scaffold4.g4720.t1